jgi:hypothetical protein
MILYRTSDGTISHVGLMDVANHYNASSKELKKVDKDVMRISGTGIELELIDVAKIDREE